ncbi:MAG: TlpA disulfide reductase family protein [Candidatus Latescibacterota bacterium]|nr:TlpA disulfide reductase family protein [Candidatus Latescibacterota bacterium]
MAADHGGAFFVLCMVGALPWLYWFTGTHGHQRLNSFRDWVIVLGAVVTLVGSQVFLHEVDYMRVSAGETSIRALHSSEAAELRFEDYSTGEQRRLSDYRGKVVVLDFWRPSCFVCVEQMSILDVLFDQYGAEGLVVIHVAAWERDRAMTYVAQNQRDTGLWRVGWRRTGVFDLYADRQARRGWPAAGSRDRSRGHHPFELHGWRASVHAIRHRRDPLPIGSVL